MHKTNLKQQYENFMALRSKGLDKTYDRFQKLINQLELNGEVISQEDANMKFLRSLPPTSNNIALIMRKKPDIETLSMDYLYNNLKVYEAEIKGKSSSGSNSYNVAFVSSKNTSNINETINAAHDIPVAGIDQNAKIALDDETQGRTNDGEMFRVDDLAGEEVVMETTTGVKDSAALITDVTEDEVTMAQALAALKSTKPKVVVQEQEMSTTIPAGAIIVTTAVPTPRAKDADRLLAERLQAKEREEFSEVEKARLEMTKVNDFIAMDSEAQESSTKKIARDLEYDISKKQKVDENVEPAINDSEELRKCIEIVPDDEDEVLIEATPISSRSPTIIDYKIHKEGKKTYFKIIKADDSLENNSWKVIHHSEVFGYIVLMKTKILIKKLKDSEDEYQV
uniref:Ribonuclease H-like domain-containing protein n=1 Tax=Tanacetum cinerariifolium TaxID=118510 RepID=A0A6L2NC31_TANCI|nr:ribonuclease H-like domain-containing protein [Tanacetum cinerariifolium]